MVTIAVDPFWTLALALLLDAAIGRPSWLARPIAVVRDFVAGLIDSAQARLNRPNRPEADLRIRGAVALALLAGAAYGLGALLDRWFAGDGSLLKAALIATFFGQRLGFDAARSLTDMTAGDGHQTARSAVAGLPNRLAADVVGPAFAYAILGLAGVFAYAVVTLTAERLDPRDPARQAFGAVPNLAARWLLVGAGVPAAALIALAAAFSPGASPTRAAAALWQGVGSLPDGRPGMALAALAGAFSLSFEGRDNWIGDGRAQLDAGDVRRALYLFVVAGLIHLTFWAALGFVTAT